MTTHTDPDYTPPAEEFEERLARLHNGHCPEHNLPAQAPSTRAFDPSGVFYRCPHPRCAFTLPSPGGLSEAEFRVWVGIRPSQRLDEVALHLRNAAGPPRVVWSQLGTDKKNDLRREARKLLEVADKAWHEELQTLLETWRAAERKGQSVFAVSDISNLLNKMRG